MKKLLLLGALGAMTLGMQAQEFTDLYKVTCNGNEVSDGETIIINEAEYDEEWGDYSFNPRVYVESRDGEARAMRGGLYATDPNTVAAFKQYGSVQFCFESSPELGGQCLMYTGPLQNVFAEGLVNVGAAGWVDPLLNQPFNWNIHCTEVEDANEIAVLAIVMNAYDGTVKNNPEAREESMTIYLSLGKDQSSVNTLGADKAPAQYFSIDGRKLDGPIIGLYIVKENGKVSKKIGR